FFFFQAEDGIRDRTVTGVQTCALPIFPRERIVCTRNLRLLRAPRRDPEGRPAVFRCGRARGGRGDQEQLRVYRLSPGPGRARQQIGRASCRERVEIEVRDE